MNKTWLRTGEFASYSGCQGDSRFVTPPGDDADEVERICWSCRVRPECIESVVSNEESGVWCASVFIPEIGLDDTPRRAKQILEEAEEVRATLAQTHEAELSRRGEF